MNGAHESDQGKGPSRILIEHSEYWLSNIGDLAMMDVTVRRLRDRWPSARIGILTDTPALMHAYFPGVDPVDPRASSPWGHRGLLARLARRAGPHLVGPLEVARVTGRAVVPQKLLGARRLATRLLGTTPVGRLMPTRRTGVDHASTGRPVEPVNRASQNTLRAIEESSLVLAMGGGYLNDPDRSQTTRVLSVLEHAHAVGVPTAMVGQGIGPIAEPDLVRRASEVLPSVGFVGLRERRKGPALLTSFGVDPAHVDVTGDDAIELAYRVRRPALGTDIGVCLRVAGYSPVSDQATRELSLALRSTSGELGAALVPVIIAEYKQQDRRSTLPLLDGATRRRDPLPRYARPQEVAEQVGGCRVMVTGAYHAAVFALSQGIPVVALTSSEYYDDKFLGLADMFGSGLELVHLGSDGLEERVHAAICAAWAGAPEGRDRLLGQAQAQIAASRAGFERAYALA